MGRRTVAPFAHVLGTLEGGIEKIPGTEGASDYAWTEPNAYDRKSEGNVKVSFKTDPATAHLRSFLLHTMRSCRELYSTCRHLGLPETSVQNKLPYFRYSLIGFGKMLCACASPLYKGSNAGMQKPFSAFPNHSLSQAIN